ncbi:hypothetical protein V202x_49170 [Gimesia aquarii]|uniref:Lipoprotein n=2 Tax=Gimesia aquarii TaxID=2527964 RepID=A0A517X1W0_9PLAN|nr:hypothetical protein V202x_49170 [Gimesia aquarii]
MRLSQIISAVLFYSILSGCAGEEDPIEARLKEVGYTPDKIVSELELRITNLKKMPAREKRSQEGAKKDGTRNDGPGGNPFTFESIIDDIKHKINQLQERSGDDVNVLDQVKQKIEEGKLDSDTRQRVLSALQ